MAERGLLDLAICRLPVKTRLKTRLALCLEREGDLRGLTRAALAALCAAPHDSQGLFDFDSPDSGGADGRKLDAAAIAAAFAAAEGDALVMSRRGIHGVSIRETVYPPLLKAIYDPPPLLFYRGSLAALADGGRALAVVGTRRPAAAAMGWVYQTARELAAAGVCVVSGLALGIDAQAHRAALDGGGATCAVLGAAVDEVYPAAHRQLAQRIVDGGGALVSEYPPGTTARKWQFPERNRIIAGLCRATLVVEAGEKSGALITADFALEQNRELLVAARQTAEGVPVFFGEGCRRLAEDGAAWVDGAGELLAALGLARPAPREPAAAFSRAGLSQSLARELGVAGE
ncbi:MAG: DNA-processing protein DprA [Spirochaetaceae bacterium]|jgi:DNA processing protein|nr:DNA-processing protein DprA [Spirochaetaceae bacterium]